MTDTAGTTDAVSVWLDGRLVDAATASVSVFDHGLLVGDGVFETLRVYDGQPFAWRRHHGRLTHSASGLGLDTPAEPTLRAAAHAVIAANALDQGRLRITVTGGISPLGSDRGRAGPTVVVAASPLSPWPLTTAVAVVPWTRNERAATAGLKTTSYADNVRALAHAKELGAGEAVFGNTRDELCEATGSNVFVVHHGIVRTPPLSSGCLAGVTRELVIEIARDAGVAVEEVALPLAALDDADEIFLTSTTREVQGVDRLIGSHQLPDPPGPVTRRLAEAFHALVGRDLDP